MLMELILPLCGLSCRLELVCHVHCVRVVCFIRLSATICVLMSPRRLHEPQLGEKKTINDVKMNRRKDCIHTQCWVGGQVGGDWEVAAGGSN